MLSLNQVTNTKNTLSNLLLGPKSKGLLNSFILKPIFIMATLCSRGGKISDKNLSDKQIRINYPEKEWIITRKENHVYIYRKYIII